MNTGEFYDHTTYPSVGSVGSSAAMRAELEAIEAAFNKLPSVTGNNGKYVKITASGLDHSALISDDGTNVTIAGDTIFSNGTIGANATNRHTIPAVTSDTFALLNATQVLKNKTLESMGLGTSGSAVSHRAINLIGNLTGATAAIAIAAQVTFMSDVTSSAKAFTSAISTQAASFTLPTLIHFDARQNALGAGSSITNQYGFFADSSLVGGANNFGFFGQIADSVGRYNLYMAGSAPNYLAGNLGVNALPTAQHKLLVGGTHNGSTQTRSIATVGTIDPAIVTVDHISYLSQPVVSAGTLPNLYGFYASKGAWTGSATNAYGFIVDSTFTGATNNYAFFGGLTAGAGRWNLYLSGTADNYIAGNLGIGMTSFGSGASRVLAIGNSSAPTTSPAGGGQLYVEAGALKYRGSSGTVTTLALA